MSLGNTGMVLFVVVSLGVTVTVGAAASGIDLGGRPVSIDATEATPTGDAYVVLEVSATLNNTGTADVSRSVVLSVGGNGTRTRVAQRTVTVPSGATETVSFEVPSEAVRPGTVRYTVSVSEGDGRTVRRNGTVALDAPSLVPTDTTDVSVVAGEEASVRATIRNLGDRRGTRTVELGVDRDRDGAFDPDEAVATAAPAVDPGERTVIELSAPTDALRPGVYAYRLASPDGTTEGTVTVLQPATFRFGTLDAPTEVVRGGVVNVSATVRNDGDVSGTTTVGFDPPEAAGQSAARSVRLDGGESRTVRFALNTTALRRGNHTVDLSAANRTAAVPLRVRESHFEVTAVRGDDTLIVGDEIRFDATIRNTGDAPDNQSVELQVDLNEDDEPESHDIERSVALDPGERTTVAFAVPYDDLTEASGSDTPIGSHIYGVYSEDHNVTGALAYEPDYDSGPTGSGPDRASLDEISQEKYGYDYDQLSNETQTQVEEIHERQPFADGLALTEVLTREELARWRFGLDVERGETFNFSAIDIDTQQRIEADFDAQFESQTGDRIESWDELARQRHDSEYEALTDEHQRAIREEHQEQFR